MGKPTLHLILNKSFNLKKTYKLDNIHFLVCEEIESPHNGGKGRERERVRERETQSLK